MAGSSEYSSGVYILVEKTDNRGQMNKISSDR